MTDFTREGSHSSSGVSEFGSEYDFEPYNAAYQSDDDDDQADDDDKSFGNKSDDLEAEGKQTHNKLFPIITRWMLTNKH